MKRIFVIVLLLLICAALSAGIFGNIKDNIEEANAAFIALGVLIGTIIGIWYQIEASLKKATIKQDLAAIATPLILQAKTSPLNLYNELLNKPEIDLIRRPDISKNTIVAAALQEREPEKVKKLGWKNLLQIGGFVNEVYQTAKPLIKAIKD